MTNWMIRKSGSNSNGGTSQTVRSSGSDGIVNASAGLTLLTSITAAWTAADIGHAVNLAGKVRIISAVTPQTSKTATTSSGSATLVSAAQFDSSMVGQAVTGPGIAANTVITGFNNPSSLTMSASAGAGFGTGTVTFYVMVTTTGTIAFFGGTAQAWVVGGAWLTYTGSAGTGNVSFAAGDSIYVGAGTYREVLNIATGGSAGLPIALIGDVDGAITGDAGEVRFTTWLTNDQSSPINSTLLDLQTFSYLSFSLLTFDVGRGTLSSCGNGGHDFTFTDCTFVSAALGSNMFSFTAGSGAQALNMTFDRCTMFDLAGSAFAFAWSTLSGVVGDVDQNVLIRNCFIFAPGNAIGISGHASSVGFKSGGVRAVGCTLISESAGMSLLNQSSVLYPCEVRNSIILCGTGLSGVATSFGAVIEDANWIYGGTPRVSVPAGPNSHLTGTPGLDVGQLYRTTGVVGPFLGPMVDSVLRGAGLSARALGGVNDSMGSQARDGRTVPGTPAAFVRRGRPVGGQNRPVVALPTVDWLNRPRPPGPRQSWGYVDVHDAAATKDTVTTDASTASAKLVGAGDLEMLVPVDASSTTISVNCRYDSAYGSQNYPTLALVANGEIGVAAQEVAAAGGAWGTWQTITLAAFTPTASGFVRIRMTSRDDSGAGQVNFDTVAVA